MRTKHLIYVVMATAWMTFAMGMLMHDSVDGLGAEQYERMIR